MIIFKDTFSEGNALKLIFSFPDLCRNGYLICCGIHMEGSMGWGKRTEYSLSHFLQWYTNVSLCSSCEQHSLVDSWISCLSDKLQECFSRCYPVQLRMEGTSLPPPSFHLLLLAFPLGWLRRSRSTGFRNALLRIKAFNVIVASLKLIRDCGFLGFFLLVNVWINLLMIFSLRRCPNSDFNSSCPFPSPFSMISRASRS